MEPNSDARHLWVLRHAKAAPAETWGGADRDRPLTKRGRRDASALGHRLAAERRPLGLDVAGPPSMAICSSAVRTQETADLVLAGFEGRVPLDTYHSLYGGGPDTVLTYLREVDEHAPSVLFVGHNPTVHLLAWELLADGSADRDALEHQGFPTCGLAVLRLDSGGWEDLAEGCATLAGLFVPPY